MDKVDAEAMQASGGSERAPTFPVSVIVSYRGSGVVAEGPGLWDVAGAVAGRRSEVIQRSLLYEHPAGRQFLWSGFEIRLYKDDAASYYYNLMGENPGLFVICRRDTDGDPRPVMVTLSYDEAAAYMEGDESVSSVPIPPEIYRWVEQFVLQHYVPEKSRKRKRDNWKETDRNDRRQRHRT